jgi:hypothetical protein
MKKIVGPILMVVGLVSLINTVAKEGSLWLIILLVFVFSYGLELMITNQIENTLADVARLIEQSKKEIKEELGKGNEGENENY